MKSTLKIMRMVSISSMILFAMLLAACGGGGGDGGATVETPGISYTGLTTPATIDEDNAEDLAAGAFEGGSMGAAMGGLGAIETGEGGHIACPRMLKVSQVLEDSLRQVDLISRSDGTFIGAVTTESGTVHGDCGGSGSYTISIDDQTGEFSGTLDFSSYCDGEVIISGATSFSGEIDVDTGDILKFNFSFDNLTGTLGTDSFTLNGNISFDVTASPATMTMAMLLQDNSTGKVYWLRDYTMTATEGANYVDVELSGRYYDPDYGYVNITTNTPFRIYDGDDWPSEGVLVITGDGNTRARLTVLSSTTYQIEADTNGDGSYDWDSGVLNWSEL